MSESNAYKALKRMTEIHQMAVSKSCYSQDQVAEKLNVNPRTIRRDIKFMKEEWKLPIRNDKDRGISYDQAVVDFPGVKLMEEEVFAFILARKAIGIYEGTGLQGPMETLFKKFTQHMGLVPSRTMELLDKYISFLPAGRKNPTYRDVYLLAKACRDRRRVFFTYHSPWKEPQEKKRIMPLCVVCHENGFYLVTKDPKKRNYPLFHLGRMADVRMGESSFDAKDFDIKEYMKNSFGIFHGEDEYKLRVKFDSWAAPIVRERKWNDTQEIIELDDGEIELRITVNHLIEIKGYILNWGIHAEVLEPPELVDDMKKEISKMLEIYS